MIKTKQVEQSPTPSQLHTLLREQLREVFDSRPAGERISSERMLAKEFGVSTATVSRALHELQQEGVLRRIPGKGTFLANPALTMNTTANYSLNRAESALQRSAGHSSDSNSGADVEEGIGVNAWIIAQMEPYEAVADFSSESWPHRIVSRLEYLITDQGGKAKITVGHTLTEEQCVAAWQNALEANVTHIFFIVNERNPLVDVWLERLIPLHIGVVGSAMTKRAPAVVQVALSGISPGYFDTVSFDGEWGAYLATAYLLQQGHRHIAFLAPPLDSNWNWLAQRILGFHRALRGFGIPVPHDQPEFGVIRTSSVADGPDGPHVWQQLGEDAAERIAADTSITAVLATNDHMASSFIKRVRTLGRAIPESLSVVGYDDCFSSAIQGLTTVRPSIDELADLALQVARKQRKSTGLRERTHLFLKPSLMIRTTTQALSKPSQSSMSP